MKKLYGFIDNNIKGDYISNKIIICILLVKLIYLIFFVICHHIYVPEDISGLFVSTGDTGSYFRQIENWIGGASLNTISRMPGIYPIYGPLYFLGGTFFARNMLVIIQFGVSVISIVVLGKIGMQLFNNKVIAFSTMLLYALSSFVSNFDIMGMMDSLSVSTLILGVYFFLLCKNKKENKWLLYSGFFLIWSFFFREIGIFAILIIGLTLVYTEYKNYTDFSISFKKILFFGLPVFLFFSIWIIRNYIVTHKFQPFRPPFSYSAGTVAIRDLVAGWGGYYSDFDGEAEWFLNDHMKEEDFPFSDKIFTSYYSLDSLIHLRRSYLNTLGETSSMNSEDKVVEEMAIRFKKSYIKEKPIQFYVFNKIKLYIKLIIPKSYGTMPFPSFQQMNFSQILIKLGFWTSYGLINILGTIGLIIFLIKRSEYWFALIPLAMITFIIAMGIVEQRYFCPMFPFYCVFTSYLVFISAQKIRSKKSMEFIPIP